MKRFFLSLLLAVGLGVSAMGASPFVLQNGLTVNGTSTVGPVTTTNVVTLYHGGASTTYTHVTNAIAAAAANDSIVVGAGKYYITATVKPLPGVSIVGSGAGTVLIGEQATGLPTPVLTCWSYGYLANLTITNDQAESTPASCIGIHSDDSVNTASGSGYTNFLADNLILYGASDTFYNRGSNLLNTAKLRNCELHGGWDIGTAFARAGQTNTVMNFQFINCQFIHEAKASHGNAKDCFVSAFAVKGVNQFYNCQFYSSNSIQSDDYVYNNSDSTASGEFYGCVFTNNAASLVGPPNFRILDATSLFFQNCQGFSATYVGDPSANDSGLMSGIRYGTNVTDAVMLGGNGADGAGPTMTTAFPARTNIAFSAGTILDGNGGGLTNLVTYRLVPGSGITFTTNNPGQGTETLTIASTASGGSGAPLNGTNAWTGTNTFSKTVTVSSNLVVSSTVAVGGNATVTGGLEVDGQITGVGSGSNVIGGFGLSNQTLYAQGTAGAYGQVLTSGGPGVADFWGTVMSGLVVSNAAGAGVGLGQSNIFEVRKTNSAALSPYLAVGTNGSVYLSGVLNRYIAAAFISNNVTGGNNIATNVVFTAPATGLYSFSGFVDTSASGAGGTVTLCLIWTDPGGSQANNAAVTEGGAFARGSNNKPQLIVQAGQTVSVGVSSTLSSGSYTYDIYWVLERLQ